MADAEAGGQGLPELESRALAERIAELAWEVKAMDVRVLRVLELVRYSDWFVVMSARSDRHAAAIREHIEEELKSTDDLRPYSVEGTEKNQWVVVDYGDVVAHIFFEPVREYYDLERLWGEAPELDLEPPDDRSTGASGE
ncbi:MAG: ribosome silencing factor [Myxococcota bacterium]